MRRMASGKTIGIAEPLLFCPFLPLLGHENGSNRRELRFGKKGAGKKDVARSAARYAVRYTIARIIAKPTKSVGARLVPRKTTVEMVAAMGSAVPSSDARIGPAS